MLPDFFKFRMGNGTGQIFDMSGTDTFTLKGKFWKIENGALVWSAEVDLLTGSTSVAVGESVEGPEQDNTSNKWHGVHLYAAASTANASVNGNLHVQMEWPTNGAAGLYPSDAANFDHLNDPRNIGMVPLSGAQARSRNFKAQ